MMFVFAGIECPQEMVTLAGGFGYGKRDPYTYFVLANG
jgi:hypothetical protein